ncbi:unnamed protein product [Pleuronectes platessa]|uniref:Uncharacterized protein n=1 Tax=Pleuronectes platessa TaxID=8262 RepID=A0A9N7Z458_PLEPL|nr:unnamed protein product [Pleuronectes platessa]
MNSADLPPVESSSPQMPRYCSAFPRNFWPPYIWCVPQLLCCTVGIDQCGSVFAADHETPLIQRTWTHGDQWDVCSQTILSADDLVHGSRSSSRPIGKRVAPLLHHFTAIPSVHVTVSEEEEEEKENKQHRGGATTLRV